MGNLPASLTALIVAIAGLGVGWLGLQILRTGFDYSAARGNPRNRAQSHESLWDIGKGAVLIGGGVAMAAFVVSTLRF